MGHWSTERAPAAPGLAVTPLQAIPMRRAPDPTAQHVDRQPSPSPRTTTLAFSIPCQGQAGHDARRGGQQRAHHAGERVRNDARAPAGGHGRYRGNQGGPQQAHNGERVGGDPRRGGGRAAR